MLNDDRINSLRPGQDPPALTEGGFTLTREGRIPELEQFRQDQSFTAPRTSLQKKYDFFNRNYNLLEPLGSH
jgi:hypothetical protein